MYYQEISTSVKHTTLKRQETMHEKDEQQY